MENLIDKKKNLTEKEAFTLALQHHQKNNLKVAENLYREILKINPNHANAHNNLGIVLEQLGESKKAMICFQKAVQINPNFARAHYNLGKVFYALNEIQKAINCFEKAIKYKSENLNYYFNLSNLKKEIIDLDLKNMITEIISKNSTSKKNIAYGNYLLAMYERKIKNYEQEINFLIKGHLNYFESKKDKYKKEINYWFNVLPKIKNFSKK